MGRLEGFCEMLSGKQAKMMSNGKNLRLIVEVFLRRRQVGARDEAKSLIFDQLKAIE